MSKEALKCLNSYFLHESDLTLTIPSGIDPMKVCESGTEGQEVKVVPFESPDLVVLKGQSCFIVEHFCFDAYPCTSRKGSKLNFELAQASKSLYLSETESSKPEYCLNETPSYFWYVQNAKEHFLKHYSKIAMYKENVVKARLASSFADIKVVFLIEDSTVLGCVCYDKGHPFPVLLACCKEFLSLLKDKDDVDYVVACSKVCGIKHKWLIVRECLDVYIGDAIDYAKMEFCKWDVRIASFAVNMAWGNLDDHDEGQFSQSDSVQVDTN